MTPTFLNPNDKISIIAPSGRVFPFELEDGLNLIRQWKLDYKLSSNLYEDFYFGYHYAGTNLQKAEDLQNALDDNETKAIWCARGGYGSAKILDLIDWTNFKKKPKWIIGYSDITAIHNHINNWNIASIHGVTVKRLNVNYSNESFETLRSILYGHPLSYTIDPHPYNQLGHAQGKLVGGNLSIIYSLIGSQSFIHGEDIILFIEDWNENWYHIDRILTNLERNGFLSNIKGLIVGSFTQMDVKDENSEFKNPYDTTTYQIIQNFMLKYNIPVCYQFPAGHTGDNRALIFGENCTLLVNKKNVTLKFNSLV